MEDKRLMLVILDGWGLGKRPQADAIAMAKTPYFDQLMAERPNATLITYGEEVGLPDGQMGNSEVGHLNIGAGRIVYQELARINKAIRERELHRNKTLLEALQYARENDRAVHFMGLVSDGGVHSHLTHLKALCDIASQEGNDKVFIHAFTDGRDVDPKSGKGFIADLLNHIKDQSAELATVIGRYYAMDRDKRWERIALAYELMVHGSGEVVTDVLATFDNRYVHNETDEFLKPMVLVQENGSPRGLIQEGDVLLCFNFRTDRPREISTVLTQEDMPEFNMKTIPVKYVTMTKYDDKFTGVDVLFHKEDLQNTLGEILSIAGKTQVRIAETEKYPHVTFFFNGGREVPFDGERRLLVNSPKVATYDLKPEMSAFEITNAIVEDMNTNRPDFICLNYANADMVGHTGVFEAAIQAVQAVDTCLEQLVKTGLEQGYETIIIADHGNSDMIINENGTPNTAHTKNPVPLIFVTTDETPWVVANGKLGDIAPTILHRMGLHVPAEMNGDLLIKS